MHAFERPLDRLLRRRKSIAVIADRTAEHQHRAARGIVQIVEDLRVGGVRVGQVDALHHAPRRAWLAPSNNSSVLSAGVERLYDDAVIGG